MSDYTELHVDMDIDFLKRFYSHPTGYGSQGGYTFLCGLPREVPKFEDDDGNATAAFLYGYDEAARLFPTEKDREWFTS